MKTGIGARLKMARSLARLSQQQVADRVDISKMAISKYESEAMTPSSGVLIRLAGALNQSLEFFLRGPAEIVVKPMYRSRASLRGRREMQVETELLEWLERYLAAESLYPAGEQPQYLQPVGFPRTVSRPEEIEEAAEALRAKWNLGGDSIENLTESLEDRGIKIGVISGNESFDACLFFLSDGSPVIAVKKGLPGDRQRFCIAHEIGHLVLNVMGDRDVEESAHRFAAAFLAPRAKVLLELGSARTSLSVEELHLLKHKYGMSMSAWIHRATDLGIINDSVAKSLFIKFSRNGWRSVEPGDALPEERPQRLVRLIIRAIDEQIISLARAEELLSLRWEDFQDAQRKEHGDLVLALGN